MANKKISELPSATEPLNDADLVEVVQGGINKKAPKSAFGGGAVDSVNGKTGVVVVDAGDIPFTPAGNIVATDVQAAVEELDGDIALKADFLLTIRTETADHTLDSTDLASINAGANLKIKMNVGSANILTIPLNSSQAFPIGTQILVQWYGAGQTSIAATGGVTINSANGWVKLAYRYSSVVLSKVGTNEWDVEGALTA
jgi:hypothetical protein